MSSIGSAEPVPRQEGKDGGKPMKVLITSTDAGFHQEIRALLDNAHEVTSTEQQGNAQIMDQIQDLQPDLILLDLDGETAYPPDLVSTISRCHPNIKILVLSGPGQEGKVLNALRAGAHGHLARGDNNREEFIAALQAIGQGDSVLSPAVAGVILDEISYRHQLSRRSCAASNLQAPSRGSTSPRT